MSTIDLQKFNIKRPEKIAWRFVSNGQPAIEQLRSKSLRSFLRNIDQTLADQQITSEYKTLTKTEFEAWLPYYQVKMAENNFDVLAASEWFDDRTQKGQIIEGIFFYRNEELVGSGIFTRQEKTKATFAFKASDRIELTNKPNSSLGAVIDYFYLKTMQEQGVEIISAGRSRNAFGVINTFGYVEYKLRFGYNPQASETSEMLTEVPTNDQGVVAFYGVNDGVMKLYLLKPSNISYSLEAARYATPDLPFEEINY